jgi:hypothetical protein
MSGSLVKNWDSYLSVFPEEFYDTYFEEKYVKLYESEVQEAVCYVYSENGKILLFPFLKRTFLHNGISYFDFETPYGYGGPICNVKDEEFIVRSLNSFQTYCNTNNFIAGFVRFHPLLNNYTGFSSIGQLLFDRHTIAIDLSLTTDEIWMEEFDTKSRNRVNKANNIKLEFIVDKEYRYLDEFVRIYDSTMQKVGADSFFYFTDNYYTSFRDNISNSFLGLVALNGVIISAGIFFYSKEYGHYHLSGSDKNYLCLNPNDFMIFESLKVMKSLGIKDYHLGGGYNSDEQNSLYQFKKKFSKRTFDFYIGKLIFNREVYDALCTEWSDNNPDKQALYKNHLLKYRL